MAATYDSGKSKSIAAVDTSTIKADKAVQIDNASDLFDVFSVHDKSLLLIMPQEMEFTWLTDTSFCQKIHPLRLSLSWVAKYQPQIMAPLQRPFPSSWSEYFWHMQLQITTGLMVKMTKPWSKNKRAEEYVQQELERFERLESQNRIKINGYQNYYSNLLVQQTVI